MDNLTLALAAGPRPSRECKFGTWVAELPEADQASMKAAMADSAWSTRELMDVLKKFGMPSAREGLTTHRQGKCAICGPL
jgi:hypothetical protein